MTREEILKLAEKSGFHLSSFNPEGGLIWWSDERPLDEERRRFAALVADAERKACTELVSSYLTSMSIDVGVAIALRRNK